jgi:hypothetical protein
MDFYSTQDITDAWHKYRTKQVLAILEGGKWRFEALTGQKFTTVPGTKAEKRWIRDTCTFPEFLEKVDLWKK